jgi:methyl-accepting chemotaxis protein
MLVIVILWALTAVIFLTGILAAANRIESRVGIINSALTPTAQKLNTLPILTNVVNNANQIREAAANLSPTIGHIADSAASIDESLKSVNNAVGPINKSAKEINASVSDIHSSVSSIAATLGSQSSAARPRSTDTCTQLTEDWPARSTMCTTSKVGVAR